jgi:hypothetical protein
MKAATNWLSGVGHELQLLMREPLADVRMDGAIERNLRLREWSRCSA